MLDDGPQHIKKPKQSTHGALRQLPTLVQHNKTVLPVVQVLLPQASRVLASYASEALHIPEGTVLVHTVQEQQQQMLQKGQQQKVFLHPNILQGPAAAPQVGVDVQQKVVLIPIVAVHVGPIIPAFPGYALLLRFAGRNGAIIYTSVDAMPTGAGNTSITSFFTIPSRSRTLQRTLFS